MPGSSYLESIVRIEGNVRCAILHSCTPRSKPLLAAFVSGATLLSLLYLGACSTTATKTLGQSTQVEGRASYYGGEPERVNDFDTPGFGI